jgi:hypothetical protein
MKIYKLFISSDSITSGTLTNATIPLNQSILPKLERPELRIETLYLENGLISGNNNLINIAMPNIMSQNMESLTTEPRNSAIVKSFNTEYYDVETTKESKGLSIDRTNLFNSGFIQIQILDGTGQPYAINNASKKWFMTLAIIDKCEE